VKEQFVLDASALLSILQNEPGQERVNRILDRSRIHAINVAEVIGRLIHVGMPAENAFAVLRDLHLEIDEAFGAAQAEFCGALLGTSRDLGLSLGDCVCITMAAWLGAVAVTSDQSWKRLDGTVFRSETIRVEMIR
jgi:PIN domain nuclease of toxin-antitoxin system